MAFIRDQGKTKLMYFPKTASTALTVGQLVILTSGQLVGATSSSSKLAGVCRKPVVSTDSDYASATLIPVEVPIEMNVTWLADFTATFSASQVGVACDLTDANNVNTGGTSHKVVTPTSLISATKGLVVMNGHFSNSNGS